VNIEALYNYVDENHIIRFKPGEPLMQSTSTDKIINFRRECDSRRLANTAVNIRAILLVGSALYGAATFLSNLLTANNSNNKYLDEAVCQTTLYS
jgi:hypothetical protein